MEKTFSNQRTKSLYSREIYKRLCPALSKEARRGMPFAVSAQQDGAALFDFVRKQAQMANDEGRDVVIAALQRDCKGYDDLKTVTEAVEKGIGRLERLAAIADDGKVVDIPEEIRRCIFPKLCDNSELKPEVLLFKATLEARREELTIHRLRDFVKRTALSLKQQNSRKTSSARAEFGAATQDYAAAGYYSGGGGGGGKGQSKGVYITREELRELKQLRAKCGDGGGGKHGGRGGGNKHEWWRRGGKHGGGKGYHSYAATTEKNEVEIDDWGAYGYSNAKAYHAQLADGWMEGEDEEEIEEYEHCAGVAVEGGHSSAIF